MNVEIVEGRLYTTASGKLLKVSTHFDHADEIRGVVYKDDGTVADFFKTSYAGFCNALKE